MNDRERFVKTLTGEKVDRVPFMKIFGGKNSGHPHWNEEEPGIIGRIDEVLKFEGAYRGWQETPVNVRLSQRGSPEIIEDTELKQVKKFRDGTVQVVKKDGDYHHHTIEWPVKTREDWERVKNEHMKADDPDRFPSNWDELIEEYANRDYPLQLTHGGVYGFARRFLMGDERLMFAFYDEPELVHEMMETYTDMVISIWDKMVKDVEFDLIEVWEDMASKNGCLISPDTFREFMTPVYKKIKAFADNNNIKIILVDSDGYINDLAGLMMEGGVTAMYPFEPGAGCNILHARETYPELGIVGGLAKESMAKSKDAVDREMDKAREYIKLGRCIPGPDHFVLSNTSWAQYKYFMEQLREVVMTTSPS